MVKNSYTIFLINFANRQVDINFVSSKTSCIFAPAIITMQI
jgi:hypothetical protein